MSGIEAGRESVYLLTGNGLEVADKERISGRRLLTTAAIVGTAVLLAAGCGGSEDSSPVVTPDTTTAIEPAPTCEDAMCYDYDGMSALYQQAIDLVDPYYDELYADDVSPAGYVFLRSGEQTEAPNCGVIDSNAFLHCGGDNKVYVGQDGIWQLYQAGGDAGVAFAVAHEVGHHIQTLAGVPFPATARETIPLENQADCMAGSWIGWADQNGLFNTGDSEDLTSALEFIAAVEGADRDHGTVSERLESTLLGKVNGIQVCNDYYSQTPIIS